MSYKYQGKKFLSLPEQVEVNKRNIEQLKRDQYRTFTTLLAIENLSYLELNQLVENSRDVSVGDLIYGSDAYYGQVTRVGGSVVEFTTVGLMSAGPKGDQGDQGPIGPQGIQGIPGIPGIPGEVQIKDMPGANLAVPDLTGKEHLGDGVYKVHNNLYYSVLGSTFIITSNSSFGVYGLCDIKNLNGIYTITHVSGVINGFVLLYNFTKDTEIKLTLGVPKTIDFAELNGSGDDWKLGIFTYGGDLNKEVKIQIEKGSQATPYTLPGQIPQYNDQFALRQQEEWLTPTLLNGTTGDVKYMKDTLGFVHLKGSITTTIPAISNVVMRLPVGYTPSSQDTLFPVVKEDFMSLTTALISNNGDVLSGYRGKSFLDGITFKAEV